MANHQQIEGIPSDFSPWRFCVAPMMEWTDRHYRVLARLHSRHARLYSEMVTSAAVIHGDRDRLLGFNASEHPVAAQLGGSDPDQLARAAKICADYGYDEVNLNVGCPSDRVQNGAFGACLMREPALVGDCVAAMKASVDVPVTVKCRIGVDDQEPRAALFELAENCVAMRVDALIVHARKAWLLGLSPKENRDIPPLDYALVHALKRALPDTPIAINGGLESIAACEAQLDHVDGVMVGRAAYHDLSRLIAVDEALFGAPAPFADSRAAVEAFLPYVESQLSQGVRLADITRHMLGLFAGRPGARGFRRHLSTNAVKRGAGAEVLLEALREIDLTSLALQSQMLANTHIESA
jgi:tRNA-dihydrouridine synthase A